MHRIRAKAFEMEESNLKTVKFAELVNLVVVHETNVNKTMSGVASMVVSIGALVGVLFGVVIYMQNKRKSEYSPVDFSESTAVEMR